MQADTGYDTTRFQALRRELGGLNERALVDGLVGVRDGVIVTPTNPGRAARRAAAAATRASVASKKGPDRSPAAAASLLALLHRRDDDESPDIPGTTFTEDGVARLLAGLRRRSANRGTGAWVLFIRRAARHLGHPVPFGLRTVQGVGLERLQTFARQLEDIQSRGWNKFMEAREVRRRKVVPKPSLTRDEAAPAKALSGKSRRKGTSR